MEVIKEIILQLDETMSNKLPPIYFYIPQSDWPKDEMPESADTYWEGFARGIYCWVLQTYLRLKADDFPCELIGTMPTEGIVFTHRDSLPDKLKKPGSKLLIVCLQAERQPHPYAQLQVVQNPQQLHIQSKCFWQSYFIPHWRQPGLIPRD